MGKILVFPGVDLNPPSRAELVNQITEVIMKDIADIFVEHKFQPGNIAEWHHQVREYFWKEEIRLVNRDFREKDLKRWRHHWRSQTLDYIQSKRVR